MTNQPRTSRECVFSLMSRLRTLQDGEYLQSLIAYHAAPTLLGIKPATLMCPGRNVGHALKHCAHCLERDFGVGLAGFRNRAGALLILVYHVRLLRTTLAAREVAELLAEAGYDVASADMDGLLAALGSKCHGRRFPHEIGVFLGYPAGDVRAFMASGGRAARCGGCWRVFDSGGNIEAARRRTDLYRRTKQRAAELLLDGADIQGVVAGLRDAVAA